MRKLLCSCCALIGTVLLQAQTINTTYYAPSPAWVHGRKVALQFDGDDIVFSSLVTGANFPYFMVTQTDGFGNHIRSVGSSEYDWRTHHIVHTRDKGYLLALKPHDKPDQIYFIKFDNNLNIQWVKHLNIMPRSGETPHENIDIEASFKEGVGERFYITFSEGSPVPGLNYETTFTILCLDDQGNQVWHRNFADYSRPPGSPLLNNEVNTITSYFAGGMPQRMITVAGTATRTGGSALFFLTVDENGNIVSPYTQVPFTGRDQEPDVAWDALRQLVVATFRSQPTIPGLPWVNSSIGLARLRFNLTYNDGAYYYIGLGSDNSGEGITVNSDYDYVISAQVDRTSISGNYGVYMLHVNANTFYTLGGYTYNINTHMDYDKQWHVKDDFDNYYFVPTIYKDDFVRRPRLIKTDPGLITCGATSVGYEPTLHQASVTQISYGILNRNNPKEVWLDFGDIAMDQTICEEYPEPDNYRPAGVTAEASVTTRATASIAPTLLYRADEAVTCVLTANAAATAEITVHNLLGQQLFHGVQQLTAGNNRFSIPAPFTPGLNIVQVSIGGKVVQTSKINVIQ